MIALNNSKLFQFNFRNNIRLNRFVISNNYEWKVGIAKTGIKIIFLTIIFGIAIIFSKIVYLYNIYLFILLLIIKDFYIQKEPAIFLEFRGNTIKQIVFNTVKMHFKIFSILLIPLSVIQLFLFYNNIFITYSLLGVLSAYLILLFIITEKYKKFKSKDSVQLTKIKNAFISSTVLLPPISLLTLIPTISWLNETKYNDSN